MRANCINSSGLNYTSVQQLFTCAGANTNLPHSLSYGQYRGNGGATEEPGRTLGRGSPSQHDLRLADLGNGRVLWE
jgi:hypothetical protein